MTTQTPTMTVTLSYSDHIETIENVTEARTDWGAETTVTLFGPNGRTETRRGTSVRIEAARITTPDK